MSSFIYVDICGRSRACCMRLQIDWQVCSTNQRCCSLPVCCVVLPCVVCFCPVCRFRWLDLHLDASSSPLAYATEPSGKALPDTTFKSLRFPPCLRTWGVFRDGWRKAWFQTLVSCCLHRPCSVLLLLLELGFVSIDQFWFGISNPFLI